MNDSGEIKRLIRPLILGSPLIIACFGIGLYLGYKNYKSAVPAYQVMVTLRLNDGSSAGSKFMKNLNSFSISGILETELEVIRSKYLVKLALEKMDIFLNHYQYLHGNKRQLYLDNPFVVDYEFKDSLAYINKSFRFDYDGRELFVLHYPEKGQELAITGKIGVPIETDGFRITISPNKAFLEKKPDAFVAGTYAFEKMSIDKMVGIFHTEELFVRLAAEEVPIVRIYFIHEHPVLCRDFANTLADVYIEDFVREKIESANIALNFLNQEIDTVEIGLKSAEERLARFKAKHQVVDLKLSTDASQKKVQGLELSKLDLEMEQTELENLLTFISSDSYKGDLSFNYETVLDPSFVGELSRLDALKSKYESYLLKYTLDHPEVKKIEKEMASLKTSLVESVNHTRQTNIQKLVEISGALDLANEELQRLPNIEKQLIIFQREFNTQEKFYNFLLEKRTEAEVGAKAELAFHKVLEYASIPTSPLKPQKTVILAVSSILGVLLAMTIIYIWYYIRAAIYESPDIEKHLDLPVIGEVKIPSGKFSPTIKQGFINLAINLQMMDTSDLITVSSVKGKDGKTLAALNLAHAFAGMGNKTLVMDVDFEHASVHRAMDLENKKGISQLIKEEVSLEECIHSSHVQDMNILTSGPFSNKLPSGLILDPRFKTLLTSLQHSYDKIVMITPDLDGKRDAVPLLKMNDSGLIVVKSGVTKFDKVKEVYNILLDYKIENLFVLLNKNTSERATFQYEEVNGNFKVKESPSTKFIRALKNFIWKPDSDTSRVKRSDGMIQFLRYKTERILSIRAWREKLPVFFRYIKYFIRGKK